jgi:hypothetical protein
MYYSPTTNTPYHRTIHTIHAILALYTHHILPYITHTNHTLHPSHTNYHAIQPFHAHLTPKACNPIPLHSIHRIHTIQTVRPSLALPQ